MVSKKVEEMSGPEVVETLESLASFAAYCRGSGSGINTKETVRFDCCALRAMVEGLLPKTELFALMGKFKFGRG